MERGLSYLCHIGDIYQLDYPGLSALLTTGSVFYGKVRHGLEATVEVAPALYWPAIILAAITVVGGVLYPFVINKLILPANSLLQVLAK